MVAPNKDMSPEHVNVILFGKSIFADVIKVRILRWGYLELLKWALNPRTTVLTRNRKEDTHTEEKAM